MPWGMNGILIKLLDRFGMVSSLDTNNQIATCIVQKRTTEGIKPSIQFGMLTVVSVDNVNILQSNAVVSVLDATMSCKGVDNRKAEGDEVPQIFDKYKMGVTVMQCYM